MREYIQDPGIKRWYGDDLVKLQSEVLEPLQGFFSQYGNCVISGCEVIDTGIVGGGGPTFQLNPGYVGIMHADGYKIAYCPGYTGVLNNATPWYLTIAKNTISAQYENDPMGAPGPYTGDGAYEYVCDIDTTSGATPPSHPYLTVLHAGITPRFDEAVFAEQASAWQTATINIDETGGSVTANIYYRKLKMMNALEIRTDFTVHQGATFPENLTDGIPTLRTTAAIPLAYRPGHTTPFVLNVTRPEYALAQLGGAYIYRINGVVNTNGTISIAFEPMFNTAQYYNIKCNVLVPLG